MHNLLEEVNRGHRESRELFAPRPLLSDQPTVPNQPCPVRTCVATALFLGLIFGAAWLF